jgi:hypothetical protein
MNAIAIAAAALGVAALSSWSAPANAATCFREVVNSPSGHRELVRGCYTRERIATRAPRRTVTTKTVTTDYYTVERPYTTTVTRDYVSEPVRRVYDEDVYYGSSMPGPRPYWWGGY